ncbi:MAG: GTP-binding protein [Promethearchaeota archaeon]
MNTLLKQKLKLITKSACLERKNMIGEKEKNISILLENLINYHQDLKVAFLYSREGLLISKYGRLEGRGEIEKEDELEAVYGAITSIAKNLFTRISNEYKIGHFGSGSFETPDHRIIFLEAGSEAILILFCDYKVNLNEIFPVAYLVTEKIVQLLEESFDFKFNSLDIPDLNIHKNFSLNLDQHHSVSEKQPIIQNVSMQYHIKKPEKVETAFKLIILGSAAVGKTTLVRSFLKEEQTQDYRATIGIAISSKKFYIQGFKDEKINFLIYDLAGQEFFKRIRHEYYKGANCAFVIYDITRRDTFDEGIEFWFKDAREELGNIPFVLIGNKLDLQGQREVSKEEGLKKAAELKSFFIETSALYHINVQDTFKLVGIGLFFKSEEELIKNDRPF